MGKYKLGEFKTPRILPHRRSFDTHKMKLGCFLVAICLVIFVTNADARSKKPYKETKVFKVTCPAGRKFMYKPANNKSGFVGGCCKVGDTLYVHFGWAFCCEGKNPGWTSLGGGNTNLNFVKCKGRNRKWYWPSYYPQFKKTKGNAGHMKFVSISNGETGAS